MVLIPCWGVSSSLKIEQADVDCYIRGKAVHGQFLGEPFTNFKSRPDQLPKIIWDIAPFAWLVNKRWTESELIESLIISDRLIWEAGGECRLDPILFPYRQRPCLS